MFCPVSVEEEMDTTPAPKKAGMVKAKDEEEDDDEEEEEDDDDEEEEEEDDEEDDDDGTIVKFLDYFDVIMLIRYSGLRY